jgi:hypothetical protein
MEKKQGIEDTRIVMMESQEQCLDKRDRHLDAVSISS